MRGNRVLGSPSPTLSAGEALHKPSAAAMRELPDPAMAESRKSVSVASETFAPSALMRCLRRHWRLTPGAELSPQFFASAPLVTQRAQRSRGRGGSLGVSIDVCDVFRGRATRPDGAGFVMIPRAFFRHHANVLVELPYGDGAVARHNAAGASVAASVLPLLIPVWN